MIKVLIVTAKYSSVRQMDKMPYGNKMKNIEDHLLNFIEPKYVSDKHSIDENRTKIRNRRRIVQSTVVQQNDPNTAHSVEQRVKEVIRPKARGKVINVEVAKRNPRYKAKIYTKALLEILQTIFNGKLPRSSISLRILASLGPKYDDDGNWDPITIRHKVLNLKKKGTLK